MLRINLIMVLNRQNVLQNHRRSLQIFSSDMLISSLCIRVQTRNN